MPPAYEHAPVVDVSTFADWEEFTRWYWNLIRRQYEVSPALSAKVAELTSGLKSESEKIRVIYDFVTGEVRYEAWEFGVHGFKPYNASTIFQRRFGDCKDKATLLCTMLGVAGIEAHPVLIHATQSRGAEDLSIPLVSHFNHCIAYVPAANGRVEQFLDGTADRNASHELPAMDRGARVLVVKPPRGAVQSIPWNSTTELSMEEEIQAVLEPSGAAILDVRGQARGDFAASLRSLFEVSGRRKVELEKIYGARFQGASVESEEFSDLLDRAKPVDFRFRLRVPQLVAKSPEGEALPVIDDLFGSLEDFGAFGTLEERKHDLLLGNPRRHALTATFRLPAGFRVAALPPERSFSRKAGRLSVRYESKQSPDGAVVTMRREMETTEPRVVRADYGEFRDLASGAARLRDDKVLIERSK